MNQTAGPPRRRCGVFKGAAAPVRVLELYRRASLDTAWLVETATIEPLNDVQVLVVTIGEASTVVDAAQARLVAKSADDMLRVFAEEDWSARLPDLARAMREGAARIDELNA